MTLAYGRTLVPGWTVNAAGRAYSNWYGFGVVNAARAVQVAENFQSLGALVDSGWRNTTRTVAIGNTSAAAARLTFQLANGARNIESVQLGFRVNHRNTRQLQFVLVSPSGTRSVVQPAFTAIGSGTGGAQSNFTSWDLLSSNAFWMRMPRAPDAGSDRHGAGRDRCIAWQPRILQDPRSGALMMKTTILLSTLAFAAMTSPAWAQSSGQTLRPGPCRPWMRRN